MRSVQVVGDACAALAFDVKHLHEQIATFSGNADGAALDLAAVCRAARKPEARRIIICLKANRRCSDDGWPDFDLSATLAATACTM